MHIRPAREEIEQVKRPNAIAPVRRVGNPVNQVQNVLLSANGGLSGSKTGCGRRQFDLSARLEKLVDGLLQCTEAESVQEFR